MASSPIARIRLGGRKGKAVPSRIVSTRDSESSVNSNNDQAPPASAQKKRKVYKRKLEHISSPVNSYVESHVNSNPTPTPKKSKSKVYTRNNHNNKRGTPQRKSPQRLYSIFDHVGNVTRVVGPSVREDITVGAHPGIWYDAEADEAYDVDTWERVYVVPESWSWERLCEELESKRK